MIPRSDWRHILKMARERGWQRQSAPNDFPVVEDHSEGSSDDAPPPIPFIQVADVALVENVEQVTRAMYPLIYTRGNSLTRLGRENLDDAIRRGQDQVVLIPVSAGWARVEASRIAQFQKFSEKNGWYNSSAPPELIMCWMGQGDWPILRPLDAIARAPFVRSDGSICDVIGYDNRSRALYIPSTIFPNVPDGPGLTDARVALERLLSAFDQFPWYDDAARSAFAAHILTEAARLALDRVPMFWYTAPDAGTGKTILSEIPSTIVHGCEPAARPWVTEGDELRKTLFASLLAGDRSIAFDNVPTGFKARAPELCAFLTSAVWKDRKLGASEVHSVPNKAVVSASGNNVTPVSDLARRCLVVRLDANSERMKERRFKITNLRGYVLEHRPELLIDALTIIKAYTAAPRIDVTPLPSFEQWSRLVREPLIWLGMADPCATQAETDDETSSIGEIFQKMAGMFAKREFTCVDIAQAAGGLMDQTGELRAMMLAHGCKEPSDSKIVGYWLRALRDKNAGGYKLVQSGQSRFGAKWLLNQTCEDLA